MRLRLSSDYYIDTDAYKREGLRISILAMSGHGKSNVAADIVEDVLDNGAQVIVVEPIPEWHTLKARYDNVVVVGGPYQDLPLEPAFAHEYVKSALEKGISLVVNVSDIEDDADQLRFVSSFLWNLYRLEQKYRRVVFLVLEEADIWAPQMWDQTSKQSLSRVSLIAKHGRKIGIFPILISQRPADLHKSPLSQCNVNLFGKFTSPADLDQKTGVMYVAKKLHLPFDEEQIMKLATGSFVVADKNGVRTVLARKRLCPHGADTPLVEAKPFTADLSQALGNLREEILKAVAAKKDEESLVKRLEKERDQLKQQLKEAMEKANIKLSVKEMMEGNTSPTSDASATSMESARLKEEILALQQKLGQDKAIIETLQQTVKASEQDLEAVRKIREGLQSLFPIPLGDATPNGDVHSIGLQPVKKVVGTYPVEKHVGSFPTDTVKGKILVLAREGFFATWKSLGDVHSKLIDDAFTCTPQAVNQALNELVSMQILGMKHTNRNRWHLAADVVFEGKKEASA